MSKARFIISAAFAISLAAHAAVLGTVLNLKAPAFLVPGGEREEVWTVTLELPPVAIEESQKAADAASPVTPP